MRHVDHHANAVHLFDDLLAKASESAVFVLVTATGEETLVVIGELHDHEAEATHDLNQSNLIFYR